MQVGRKQNLRAHPSVRTSRVCRNPKSDIWRARYGCAGIHLLPLRVPSRRHHHVRRPGGQPRSMGGVARPCRAARLGRPNAPGSSRSVGRCGPRATRTGFDSSHTAAGAVGSKGLQSRRDHDTVHPPGAGELEGRAVSGPRAAAVQAARGRPRRAAGASGRAPGLRRLGGSPLLHPAPISSPGRPGAPRGPNVRQT